MQAFLSAREPGLGFDGTVGFYGILAGGRSGAPPVLDHVGELRGPLLGLFGEADRAIPVEQVEAFDRGLAEAGVEHEVVVYPGAPHSFFDRSAAEHAEASQDAWRRVLGFLDRWPESPGSGPCRHGPGGAPWRTCPPAGSSSSPPTACSRSTSPGRSRSCTPPAAWSRGAYRDRGRRGRRRRAGAQHERPARSSPTARWPTSAATSTRSSSPAATASRAAAEDAALVAWVARAPPARSRRVASVCTGAFLLAAAGLLDGRRADDALGLVRRARPRATRASTVDPDPIFVRDGDVWTSAGVTAGMDLALALVEEDLGRRRRARGRALARRCSCSARAASRSSARSSARRPPSATPLRDLQALDRRPPRRRPARSPALAERACDEPAQLRARVPRRGRHDARPPTSSACASSAPGCALERPADAASTPSRARCGFGTRRDHAPRLPPPRSASAPPTYRRPLPPARPDLRGAPMEIAIPLFDASPPSTPSGPTRCCSACPAPQVALRRPPSPAPVRTDNGMLGSSPTRRSTTSRSPTSSSCPAASARAPLRRRRAAARVDPRTRTRRRRGRRRCAPARCCSAAAGLLDGARGDDPLVVAATCSRRTAPSPTQRARRRAGQDHHRRRRVVGHRHGAHAGRADRRRRRRAGHPARHRVRPPAAVRRRLAGQGARPRRRPSSARPSTRAGRARGCDAGRAQV